MGEETSGSGIDEVIKQLGPTGKHNIINYALLLFPCYLAGMYGSVYNFEALDISYRCEIPECETINTSLWLDHAIPKDGGEYSKCKRYQVSNITDDICSLDAFDASVTQRCTKYVYSGEDSIVKDFDLGCQNWKRTLIGTIHNAGLFASLPLTGLISDKFGRKVALPLASLMNGICGVARSFSTSYLMLAVLEFAEAALGGGAYVSAFVLAMELVLPNGRVFGNTLINFAYISGLMTLAGLAWSLQNWRYMLRIMYIPAIFVLSYLYILNESPRWLLSKGKHEKAVEIIRKAAKMNKVDILEHTLSSLHSNDDKKLADVSKKSMFLKLVTSKEIRKRVLVCSYMWITCTFVYYGLSINSVSLAGNRYMNFMLVAFVEMPANVVCYLILDKFGRKRILILTYMLSAILCIGLSFLPKGDYIWPLLLYLCGKFSITIAYSSVYIYVSELFPTNARQFLVAICSCTGRVGSTLAPLTPLLALYYENLPAIFFGCLAFIASVLVFTMPETLNVSLPDSIEEAERISQLKQREKKMDII